MSVVNDITHILTAIEQGDPHAAAHLLPLVYEELRRLAAHKMAQEKPGQTLQATALVHEAYLRLVASPGRQSGESGKHWDHRGHFFAAAAEAMRRILVEKARSKQSAKHGGGLKRSDVAPDDLPVALVPEPLDILAIHEALDRLAARSPRKAELVKLRYFLGCTIPEAAELLGIAPATAEEDWTFARAWLRKHLGPGDQEKD
jgi:RNA polymerase sigma factor (TIGR02999 family)